MWGYEYIADCGDCDYDKLHSLENIQAFVDELCERTCMKKMGPLHSHYLEENEYIIKNMTLQDIAFVNLYKPQV